jgi:hypothetical protein
MSKYEALVNLTIEGDANEEDDANEAIYGEFLKRLLDGIHTDSMFTMWAEVVQLEKMDGEE